ncbi:MAG TPA: hypothetical protein VMV83_05955 [Rectinemataceae bacterium]|nr:hypothetical protein [Rectinemataceae bacterium]
MIKRSVPRRFERFIKPSYLDREIETKQLQFDALVERGASLSERNKYLEKVFIEHNRKIRIRDYEQMNPATISSNYLRPRKDLSQFILSNWVKHLFVPGLKPDLADKIFMFGIGRIFSAYNDVGVQAGTDADLNIIVDDGVSPAAIRTLTDKMHALGNTLHDRFGITIEINPAFTVLKEKTVLQNIEGAVTRNSKASLHFYKANAKSLFVLKDHERIRKSVFSRVDRFPDSMLFENFLGVECAKPSYMKLHLDIEPLLIVVDGSGESVKSKIVIGSRNFDSYCRSIFPREFFIAPPDWIFSMKYFVNRVYDYICAMRNIGYGLADIGLSTNDESDPDFAFLRNAHMTMLFLQELTQMNSAAFGETGDFSYISRSRFLKFAEIRGDKFRQDFEEMILGGGLLQFSNRAKYKTLRAKVDEKARDRIFTISQARMDRLPEGFEFEMLERNETGAKICVPYSWADLGYFAFCVIASRITLLVDARLYPAAQTLAREGKAQRN